MRAKLLVLSTLTVSHGLQPRRLRTARGFSGKNLLGVARAPSPGHVPNQRSHLSLRLLSEFLAIFRV